MILFPKSRRAHEGECPCCTGARLGRREVIGAALAGLACTATGAEAAVPPGPRRLSVRRAHTEDSFEGVYFDRGRYVPESLQQLNWVFRDLSREELTPMDPRLFDVMFAVARQLDATEGYDVISGYRTPETNGAIAARTSRASTVSLHMSGMAGDMRLPGHDSYGVARLAARMGLGGVGLYRRDGFVHLDCGTPRRW